MAIPYLKGSTEALVDSANDEKSWEGQKWNPSIFSFCSVLSTLPRQLQNNLILLGVSHRFVIAWEGWISEI